MERYVCIHGHFYQPPRENPWLEAIEVQDSAHPYHDWNERVTAECYAANAATRILDHRGFIDRIVNNYSRLSFNFGPTLLSWLEHRAPETYEAVITADRESRERFSGHGSALAQAYNHLIMPLAVRRDQVTQARWGVADFEHRFGRKPEGMWLPEAAVNLETLEVLADEGIRFTILAPHQAHLVRKIGDHDWTDVGGDRIDPSMAYLQRLPSGKSIALFFYDGPASRAVAFERLLAQGEKLAQRLMGLFSDQRPWPQLAHIATDGETYGHHHQFGDMALAYALDFIEGHDGVRLTNYGEFLELHPPTHEVQIFENTSWSCAHGIERWRSDCGCHTGGEPGWNQAWRAPLREALDWLRDRTMQNFEDAARELTEDPWAARDHYIEVILDRSEQKVNSFVTAHTHGETGERERTRLRKLMEMERQSQLMYTSCGWFFNDLAGIETVQVLCYAARVIQLARDLFDLDLEPGFLEILARAKSNDPKAGDGRKLYETQVRPSMVDLPKVMAHFAVSSIFDGHHETNRVECYEVKLNEYHKEEAGKANLVMGRGRVTSTITGESARFSFGVLHLGDHNLTAGVKEFRSLENHQRITTELLEAFTRADFPEVWRRIDRDFEGSVYSIKALFRDQQRKVLREVMENVLAEGESFARNFYEYNAPIMRYLTDLRAPLPKPFQAAAELVVNLDLGRIFENGSLDLERARHLIEEADDLDLPLNREAHGYHLGKAIERQAEALAADPADRERLTALVDAVDFAAASPFPVNYWRTQNLFWRLLRDQYPSVRERAGGGDAAAQIYVDDFLRLGELLKVRVD